MLAKTMDGLLGARINMDLVRVPMKVYREAKLKKDTETMKRAMGYANEFSDKAQEYQVKADEGMIEDAKEAREKAELELEEAIERRRKERAELEEQRYEQEEPVNETETSTENKDGKILLKNDDKNTDPIIINNSKTDTETKTKPISYTKNAEATPTFIGVKFSLFA